MDFFIKKIFDGKNDESVHIQFQKFSRGKFANKALIRAKNSKGKFTIGTSYEYANELVRTLAEKLGSGRAKVSGVVISTRKLKEEPEFSSIFADSTVKQFAGVRQYGINKEMSGDEIMQLCDRLPNAVISLSFAFMDTDLKVKAKAPKSGKPSTKENEKPPADYCKLKTSDKGLVKGLLFDVELDNFKVAEIEHDFVIEDIELPKGVTDPLKMRELAKRKGKIIRKTSVDGNNIIEEKKFEA